MSRKKKKRFEKIRSFMGDLWDWDYPEYGVYTPYEHEYKPKKKYVCFMLNPTNTYQGFDTNNTLVTTITSDAVPIDTLDVEYHQVYTRQDTGEEVLLKNAPTGAMWFAPWLDELYNPQLEHVLVIKLPDGHEFVPDSKAANCRNVRHYEHHQGTETNGKKVISAHELAKQENGLDWKKQESSWWKKYFVEEPIEDEHHCWIIHGTVPNITIDKHGYTCSAGAGSIDSKGWHGFLKEGVLE